MSDGAGINFDLIVVGTGTAALVAARAVRKAGWTVAVIDEKPFGGTCALRGCDPKKMLVAGAEVIDVSPHESERHRPFHSVSDQSDSSRQALHCHEGFVIDQIPFAGDISSGHASAPGKFAASDASRPPANIGHDDFH